MQLRFEHVTKYYGPILGVNDVTCELGPGITGLLGANGAGKSTLIRLVCGQMRPSLGRVLLDKHLAWSTAAKRLLGYCPDSNQFYEDMTGGEFVYTMASLYGYSHRETRRRAAAALDTVEMTASAGRRLGGYSHGMRQRIKLAQALVHDPPLLVLDEPLTGIDPGGRHAINQLLQRLAADGKTIVVSTHLLGELDTLAHQIMVLSRGRLVALGTTAEIRSQLDDEPRLISIDSTAARQLATRLVEFPEVDSVRLRHDGLDVQTRQPARFYRALGELACDASLDVRRVESLDTTTEAVFGLLERSGA